MYASTSFTSRLLNDFLVESHTRRLLIQDPLHRTPTGAPASTSSHNSTDSYFGAREIRGNVLMILAILLCAFICSLGLNLVIRCALRFSNVVFNNQANPSPQLANNKGIEKKALKTFPTVSYSAELKLPGLDTECVICLSEFTKGDKVRILPKCNHGFHVRCIDKWLMAHSSCPKCRHCLIETCQKIVRLQPLVFPVPETIIRIHPLEPEALESNYRGVS